MAKGKFWTSNEEKILDECLKKCSTISEACRMASKKIGRSAKAIEQRYYYRKHVLTLYKEDSEKNTSMFDKFVFLLKEVFMAK